MGTVGSLFLRLCAVTIIWHPLQYSCQHRAQMMICIRDIETDKQSGLNKKNSLPKWEQFGSLSRMCFVNVMSATV